MAEIKKLSQELIGKIAAGEVVERPASVVKELVENAIDAGATNVTVELRGGGIEYIRISDNGQGIPAEQVRMAFERHATSKLQTSEQLFDIHTLGFRGEALASVAAVAKVTCTTKTALAPFGTRCVVEGGEFTDIRQAASPVGTTFVVEDLFYNTPVRRKFLKKPVLEASLVSDYMLRLILSHPEVAFRFVSQGKTVYHSMGDGKLDSALFCLYGKDALQQMFPVQGSMNGLLLKGYVGTGELCRGNRQQQSFFINGRYFRSGVMSRALESGCEGRVMIGKFPMCALFLQLPYQNVDVNVHPNKLEVRFQNEAAVAAAVTALVSDALHAKTLGESLTQAPPSQSAVSGGFPGMPAPQGGGFVVVKLGEEEVLPTQAATPLPETAAAKQNGQAAPPIAAHKLPEPVVIPIGSPAASPTLRETPAPAHTAALLLKQYQSSAVESNAQNNGEAGEKAQESAPASARMDSGSAPDGMPETVEAPESRAVPASKEAYGAATGEQRQSVPAGQPSPSQWPLVNDTASAPSQALPPDGAARPNPEPASRPAPEPVQEEEQTRILPEQSGKQAPVLIGIVFDTYWIFQAGDRLLLLDQHAAHERILYDRLMKRLEGDQISQQLLSPQLVKLNPRDMALTIELSQVLQDAGFDVNPFDDDHVALRAIPTLFGQNESPRELLMEALDQWQAGRGQATRERMRRQIAQMACKHAIKGGDKLNENQIQGFLAEMLQSDSMPTCPHGRPIVTELTRYELEKRFKRIQ